MKSAKKQPEEPVMRTEYPAVLDVPKPALYKHPKKEKE